MFSLLLEKEPSDEEIPEEAEDEEEEEEEEQPPDEETIFFTQEITECFALFDKNNSGTFDVKYLDNALKALGMVLSPTEVQEVAEVIAINGAIPFHKFFEYTIKKMKEIDPGQALKLCFQAFDLDKEGVLPTDRLKRWLTTLGDPLTEKEVKDFIKLADPGKKGVVVYGDLMMILLKKL